VKYIMKLLSPALKVLEQHRDSHTCRRISMFPSLLAAYHLCPSPHTHAHTPGKGVHITLARWRWKPSGETSGRVDRSRASAG
jgi:hypothetical protein